MLHPSLHLLLIAERQLASIITNTLLTYNVLVFMIKLLAESENAVTVGANIGKFLFLRLRLSSPYNTLGHPLSVIVLGLGCISLSNLALLLEDIVSSEACPLLIDRIFNTLVPPPSLRTPCVVFRESTHFSSSVE